MTASRHILLVSALFFCAQWLLAWHGPSHLAADHDQPLELINVTDCDVCLSGQAAAPPPALTTPRPLTRSSCHRPGTRIPATRAPLIPGAGPRAPPELS